MMVNPETEVREHKLPLFMEDHIQMYDQEPTKMSNQEICTLGSSDYLQHGDQVPPNIYSHLDGSQRLFSYDLDLPDIQPRPWQLKPPHQWDPTDVTDWIIHWALQNSVEPETVNTIGYMMSGLELCQLSRSEFCKKDYQYGEALYEAFRHLQINYNPPNPAMAPLTPEDINLPIRQEEWSYDHKFWHLGDKEYTDRSPLSGNDSDHDSRSSTLTTVNKKCDPLVVPYVNGDLLPSLDPTGKQVRGGRRGRPPKRDPKARNRQGGKGTGKLWEFIRDLLLNPNTNPSLIRWERREEGVFKFIQSDKVAKMWGERKQNTRMTYEKLSRAMRYYYKSQVLLPVFGRRLVYKFGPNATGWRPGPQGAM